MSRARSPVVLACAAAALLASTSSSAQSTWPTEVPPRPLPASSVKFPPYDLQTLPNGLKVVVVLHHEQPVVSMRIIVRAGSSLDPKGKLGVASFAAGLLDQGTTTKTAQEIADTIDFIGGAESTGAGTDLSFLNMVVMKDGFDLGMRLLSDMARNPAYAQVELDRQRQQALSGQRVSFEDPGFVANAVFDRLVYGFHPYGMPQGGTPESIPGISREDLMAFHEKYFAPNNAILALVGDVTAGEAFAEAAKVFGDWKRKEVPAVSFVDPPDATRRVIVVNKPDAVQTEVRVGHIGVSRKSQDYMALNLAIRILGGEGSNRLHQVLRTERGLTYGAQANMDTLKESGDFEAETNTRSEATGEVLRLIVDEFWRLQRERVGERELNDAKAYLTGSFPLTIETPDAIALQVLNVLFYDLPIEQLQTFRERVNAITPDDIQRVARWYLKPDRLSIVLVGNASAFVPQLKGVGFNAYESVEIGDLDLVAADFKRAPGASLRGREQAAGVPRLDRERRVAYREASQQAPSRPQSPAASATEEGERAKALLDRAIAAKGGVEVLRSVKTIAASQQLEATTPGGPVRSQSRTLLEYPDRFRVETETPNGMIVQGFDGEHAWVQDPGGVHDVPESVSRDARENFRRDIVVLMLEASRGNSRARRLPDVKEADGSVRHVLELTAASLDPVVWYLDDQGLITKQTFVAPVPGRPLVEETFGDYRAVDGLQFPFKAERRVGPMTVSREVIDVKINTPIDPAQFKRPSS